MYTDKRNVIGGYQMSLAQGWLVSPNLPSLFETVATHHMQ